MSYRPACALVILACGGRIDLAANSGGADASLLPEADIDAESGDAAVDCAALFAQLFQLRLEADNATRARAVARPRHSRNMRRLEGRDRQDARNTN